MSAPRSEGRIQSCSTASWPSGVDRHRAHICRSGLHFQPITYKSHLPAGRAQHGSSIIHIPSHRCPTVAVFRSVRHVVYRSSVLRRSRGARIRQLALSGEVWLLPLHPVILFSRCMQGSLIFPYTLNWSGIAGFTKPRPIIFSIFSGEHFSGSKPSAVGYL